MKGNTMHRRDFVKAAPVLAAAAAVGSLPAPSSHARVVWAAYCTGPDMKESTLGLPRADAYCAAQRAKGRSIIGRLDRAGDTTLVFVAEDYEMTGDAAALGRAQQIIDRFRACHTTAEADFGSVLVVAAITEGQAVDIVALLREARDDRVGRLERDVASLLRERQAEKWSTATDDRPHHLGAPGA